MKRIKLLDAFAGIGGFHLGVKQACEELNLPFECVGAIELDKNARKTYTDNFPDVEMFDEWGGDITKIPMDKIPDHDLLTGGFPCQPFSMAGKAYKNNKTVVENDNRKDLFEYLIQILEYKKPEMFIFENVAGILNLKNGSNHLIIDIIKEKINTAGYNVVIKLLNSKNFGAPQNRKRVFFIGYKKDTNKIPTLDIIIHISQKCICDILENNVNDKYLLKNVWKNMKNRILPGMRYDTILDNYNNGKWNETDYRQNNTISVSVIEGDTPSGHSRQTDRVYSILGISPTLICTGCININNNGNFRRLTPREYARIQGFPDTFKLANTDCKNYKQFGNAVCVNMVKYIVIENIKNA